MKNILILITFLLTSAAYANGGSVGGPGPKPVKDAVILDMMNDFGDWEGVEINLDQISEILTQDDLILTQDEIGYQVRKFGEVQLKEIHLIDGRIFSLSK